MSQIKYKKDKMQNTQRYENYSDVASDGYITPVTSPESPRLPAVKRKRVEVIDMTSDSETDNESVATAATVPLYPSPEFKPYDGNNRNPPSKSWFYTHNNYTDADVNKFEMLECVFHIFGKEVSPSGTPHLQGCITFAKSCRLTALKTLSSKTHWEIPKSLEAARNYCMKDADCFLRDNRKQGARTDLILVTDMIKKGSSMMEVAEAYPSTFVKYPGGLTSYQSIIQKPREDKPIVNWYWGPTGAGKTACVHANKNTLFTSDCDFSYFNGYENQYAALFDDFRGKIEELPMLLRLFDRYPLIVNVKYGSKQWNPKVIYVTSCYPPDHSFVNPNEEDMNQLLRRIDNIVEFLPYDYTSYPMFDIKNVKTKITKGLFQIK